MYTCPNAGIIHTTQPCDGIRLAAKTKTVPYRCSLQPNSLSLEAGHPDSHHYVTIRIDWGKTNTPWDESYAKLKAYKEQRGNCLVPTTYEPDQPFATWVMTQRYEYQLKLRGEQSSLTDDRIAQLEELEFDWGRTNTPSDESYAKQQEYKEQRGNCLVPQKYEADQPFATWVKNQRSEYQ